MFSFRRGWLVVLFPLAACNWITQAPECVLTVMSWNTQNLFDDVANGLEPPEFDPERGVWNRTLFLQRLEQAARVVREAASTSPDVVALQEVENENVVETLNRRFLTGQGYCSIAPGGQALRVRCAFLTRLAVRRVHLVHLPDFRGEPQRPILELEVETDGQTVVIWNNHWKSRRSGEEVTEEARRLAAELLTERARWLRERAGTSVLLAVGDFNSPLEGEEALVGWVRLDAEGGTYFFEGKWSRLDHGLVFPPLPAEAELTILDRPFLKKADGTPRRYSATDRQGYSDHFPILVRLVIDKGLSYTESHGIFLGPGLSAAPGIPVSAAAGLSGNHRFLAIPAP